MTSSRPLTLDDYINQSRIRYEEEARRLQADAERRAREWSREFSMGPPQAPLYERVGSLRDTEYYYRDFLSAMSSGKVSQEKDHMAVNRDNYDVSPVFDNVMDTLNAAIQNIGSDVSQDGIAELTESGLNSVKQAFSSLVDVRNQFYRSETSFAKSKPEPVAELIPDEDGIIRNKYGDVIGRVNLSSQGE